jgi:hypothetical protein
MISFDKAFTNSVNTRPSDPFDFKGGRSSNGANVADRMQSGQYSGKEQTLTNLGRSNTYNIIGSKSKELRSIENSELSALLRTFKQRVRKNAFDDRLEYINEDVNDYASLSYFDNYNGDQDRRSSSDASKHRDPKHLAGLLNAIFNHLKHLENLHNALTLKKENHRGEETNPFRTLVFRKTNDISESFEIKRNVAKDSPFSNNNSQKKQTPSLVLSRFNQDDAIKVQWQ